MNFLSLDFVSSMRFMEWKAIGPTKGTPRHIGALLASTDPYKLDLACAKIIGLEKENVTTLEAAYKRGLIPSDYTKLTYNEIIENYFISDYKNIPIHSGILFDSKPPLIKKMISKSLQSTPLVEKSKCISCKKCFETCPAKAITMKNNKPVIDRKKCISCFCCQEFCPAGAIKSKRPFIAKLLN